MHIHIDSPDDPRPLPNAWRNVSGLNLLDQAALANLGWLPWIDAPAPAHDAMHERAVPSVQIEAGQARRVWTITRRPDEQIPTVDAIAEAAVARIKADCQRAIEARYPLWRQSNAMARAIELLDILRQRSLTDQEQAERAQIEAIRAWINAQRAKSDRLEADIAEIRASGVNDDEKRRTIGAISFTEASA